MRCHCLTCAHRREDKNCATCVRCERRVDYLRELEAQDLCGMPGMPIDGPSMEAARADMIASRRRAGRDDGVCSPEAVREVVQMICHEHRVRMSVVLGAGRPGRVEEEVSRARADVSITLHRAPYHLGVRRIADVLGLSENSVRHHLAAARNGGRDPRFDPAVTGNPVQVLRHVCRDVGIEPEVMLGRRGGGGNRRLTEARLRVVAVLRGEPWGLGCREVANVLRLTPDTVSNYTAMAKEAGLLPKRTIYGRAMMAA